MYTFEIEKPADSSNLFAGVGSTYCDAFCDLPPMRTYPYVGSPYYVVWRRGIIVIFRITGRRRDSLGTEKS